MTTIFLTCNRPVSYIGKSLLSISAESKLMNPRVFMEDEKGYELKWKDFPVTRVNVPQGNPNRWKLSFVACAALGDSTDDDLLMCEDDILFTRDTYRKLQVCLSELPVKDFLMSLYWPGPLTDKPIEHVNPQNWFGSQAVYIPKSLRLRLAHYIQDQLEHGLGIDYSLDLAMADFCEINTIPLFTCNPSLVQHIGDVSAASPWMTGKQHKSPTFEM